MKKNVTLIGMPGSGKSTVGVVLAKVLGYHFVDSDLVIQEQTGKLLHELITEYGDEGFLEIENKVNAGLQVEKSVIATGGSAVFGEEAMEHLPRDLYGRVSEAVLSQSEKTSGRLEKARRCAETRSDFGGSAGISDSLL